MNTDQGGQRWVCGFGLWPCLLSVGSARSTPLNVFTVRLIAFVGIFKLISGSHCASSSTKTSALGHTELAILVHKVLQVLRSDPATSSRLRFLLLLLIVILIRVGV